MTSSTTRAFMAKKQSTSFAQVATNLLNVLQGYTKTIRLLLVIFLTLTVSANAWGQTWTRVTTMEQLTSGGTFIMGYEAAAKSGIIVPLRSADCNATTSANGYFYTGTTANSSTNSTITMSSVVNTSAYEVYISSPASGKINIQRATSTGNYYGASSGGSSKNTARLYTKGNTTETNLIVEWASETNNQFKLRTGVSGIYKYLKYNTSSPRFAFYNSAGEKIVFYKKSATSFTVTAKSNNDNYGTVSLEGTTITASPKTGYRVSTTNPYSISPSGSAKVTQSENKFTVTPTANCTITINFEALPKYTVTLNAGPGTCAAYVTETSAGAGVDLPTPTICDGWTFAGWATSAVATETSSKPATLLTGTYKPTSNITLYAVYQRTDETEGGGSVTSQTDEVTISDFGTDTSTRTYSATYADWTWAKNSGSDIATYDEIRLYANHSMKISPKSGYTISSIVATCTNSSYANALAGSKLEGANKSVSSSTVTITPTSGDIVIKQAAQSRVSKFTVTYTTTASGTTTTTYYHSTPDCGITQPSNKLRLWRT